MDDLPERLRFASVEDREKYRRERALREDEAARFQNNLGLALNSSKNANDEILSLNTRLLDLLDQSQDHLA